MKKALPALLLTLLLFISLVPLGVSAADAQPISTAAEFEAMDPNGSYYLANDIDFGGKTYEAFIVENFSGQLDGRGHTLFNYTIQNNNGSTQAGTFKTIGTAAQAAMAIKNSTSVSPTI